MPIVRFHKATNPTTLEEVRVQTDAILYVEELPDTQIGRTTIQVTGLHSDGIRITESLAEVLIYLPALVSTFRHYHAGAPPEGASVVHIAPHNVSHILPNVSHDPAFWTLHFRDESELRVTHPLPANL